MIKKILSMLLAPTAVFAAQCNIINKQCTDNAATKTIDGITFTLAEVCSKLGLTGQDCCWNNNSTYYCGDQTDTCGDYRKNANCSLMDNTCIEKDYISGQCNKFQSRFSCAGGYQDVESRVCTNVVCSNNESGTASKCYSPPAPSPNNTSNMSSVIAYLQMGQNMAQEMNCSNPSDPSSCTIFAGQYANCYMYMFKKDQPGTWNNGGADCLIHQKYFTDAKVATGYAASDRNLYSQATSGTGSVMGNPTNYGMSNDSSKAINNTVKLQQQSNSPAVNQDQKINYTPNNSRNSDMVVKNGQVVSIAINKDTVQNLSGLTSFEDYLTTGSVNLAWSRMKAEPDPNNVKNLSFTDEGIVRQPSGRPFGWNSGISQPVINGLCVHLADSCEGGDDSATGSDLIKAMLSWAGGLTNPNFCAHCTLSVFGTCVTGEPRNVKQEWCCFNSKVSMDINLAAYDQGLLNFYTGNSSRYSGQVNNSNGVCGGVTVGMVSQIDFSKGNYFNDLMGSMDINQIIDTSNFTNVNIQNNTQTRSNGDATNMVNNRPNK